MCIFIHESLCYKLRKDLSINSEAIESLSIETSNKKSCNLILNVIYRPPTGDNMKKISKFSITNYFQSIGMKLKTALIPMGLISSFLIYLTQFMIYISQRF